MDVIGFLCVSLGSSTVQLHDSLRSRHACACSEAGFSSQYGDRSVVRFCEQKDSMQRIFIKKCFLFTMGSVCLVKRFTTGLRNVINILLITKRLKRRCGSGWEQQSKDSHAAGFDALLNRWDMCVKCWRRLCREISIYFQVRISHVLRFISICDLFTDSPSYIMWLSA
jgi:hypothetical protein